MAERGGMGAVHMTSLATAQELLTLSGGWFEMKHEKERREEKAYFFAQHKTKGPRRTRQRSGWANPTYRSACSASLAMYTRSSREVMVLVGAGGLLFGVLSQDQDWCWIACGAA